jgi:hypothetical protein
MESNCYKDGVTLGSMPHTAAAPLWFFYRKFETPSFQILSMMLKPFRRMVNTTAWERWIWRIVRQNIAYGYFRLQNKEKNR